MARLPVRLDVDPRTGVQTIELAPAIQKCLRESRRRRIAANAVKAVTAVGSVLIVVLVRLIDLDQGPSLWNRGLLYGILGLASATSLAITLAYQFGFEREAYRRGSAARALERVRDAYAAQAGGVTDPREAAELLLRIKENVNEIERLIDDARVLDIDLHFRPAEPRSSPHQDNQQPATLPVANELPGGSSEQSKSSLFLGVLAALGVVFLVHALTGVSGEGVEKDRRR